jgi:hypothetical protein
MEIQYENSLPKGYLRKRKAAGILYIFSVYLYCLFLLLMKTEIIKINDNLVKMLLFFSFIAFSCCLLCFSVIAGRNFKGIKMNNYNDVRTFTKSEKLLFMLPAIATAVFFPFEIICYVLIAGFIYLVVSRVE